MPQQLLHPLAKASYIVGICTGLIVLITTVIMWVSGIAWASDVAALEAKHDADMKQMKIFSYQKDIDELQLKPNKTQYDQDRLKLWQNKINGMQ